MIKYIRNLIHSLTQSNTPTTQHLCYSNSQFHQDRQNDAHGIEKLLLKTQVREKFLLSEVNLIIQYMQSFCSVHTNGKECWFWEKGNQLWNISTENCHCATLFFEIPIGMKNGGPKLGWVHIHTYFKMKMLMKLQVHF